MRKSIFLLSALFTLLFAANAQHGENTWGVKGGLIFPMDGFSFQETGQHIKSVFEPENQISGWHAGIFGRAYMGDKVFAHGSLAYLNTKHNLHYRSESELIFETIERHGAQIDAGLGIEFLNFLRVQGGVNGLAYLGNDWNESFDTFGTGYSFGAGVDLWKITLDVTYSGAFSGTNGNWKGIPMSHNRSDLMLTLGICF